MNESRSVTDQQSVTVDVVLYPRAKPQNACSLSIAVRISRFSGLFSLWPGDSSDKGAFVAVSQLLTDSHSRVLSLGRHCALYGGACSVLLASKHNPSAWRRTLSSALWKPHSSHTVRPHLSHQPRGFLGFPHLGFSQIRGRTLLVEVLGNCFICHILLTRQHCVGHLVLTPCGANIEMLRREDLKWLALLY